MKKKYGAETNTNLVSNRFSQTQPIQNYEAETNTNLPINRITQTQEEQVNTQSTYTPTHIQINTPNNICKCEDEMD